jgi:hypothetical protein
LLLPFLAALLKSWGTYKDFPGLLACIPVKKTRGKAKFTKAEKKHNRELSLRRIKVEHAICRIKKYEVINGVYRTKREDYNLHFRNVVSLTNFRITHSVSVV